MLRFQTQPTTVDAAKVLDAIDWHDGATKYELEPMEDGDSIVLPPDAADYVAKLSNGSPKGGYLVRHDGGHWSWVPDALFLEDYTPVQPSSGKSGIKGYRELTEREIAAMNAVKELGIGLGRMLEEMRGDDELDQRWVSEGATDLQKGLMSWTRAIAKPDFF